MNLFEYKSFHDTNGSTREEVETAEKQCSKQERDILKLFVDGQYISQPAIRRAYFRRYGKELQIASCSRGVSNLTDLGYLEKTDVRVDGEFGKKVWCWMRCKNDNA